MMKSDIMRRLARLEDNDKQGAGMPDPADLETKKVLIAIVAFHVGGWSNGAALATAWARALEISAQELKRQLSLSPGDLWAKTVAHLETLAGAEWWKNAARLDELYAAIPPELNMRQGFPDDPEPN
jgi:hypothetical protein